MTLPTEPIGSIPRPEYLIEGLGAFAAGRIDATELAGLESRALADTISRFEETGSPVVSDGEQGKPSFATYPLAGLTALAPDGVVIPFADGHTRQLPRLTAGPFRYATHADEYLTRAKALTDKPVKQAVIAASAISLIYPGDGIDGYSQEQFVADLVNEAEADIRRSLDAGAHSVQIDFTEGRLSLKLDPSGGLLRQFVDLNNAVLERFTAEERAKIGVHTCPGGDQDSVHSLDVDYAGLLPALFSLKAGNFYVQLASEAEPAAALEVIRDNLGADQRIFVGVTDPIDPRVETPEEVRDRVLAAAKYLPADRLGTCDDCGFSPFADDTSTSRDIAFAKIRARVEGTLLAADKL
ncbi:cobalamin-independent methionine synthase II family protein [Amycolatopsis sp. RTGN1]|uniref:cobalamin-independent methionine synthase II family protein n=1 Tax=Amycolatopsis ponsaeliensis TaxID=2992142 RepID=UPI00254A0FA6|nr:cobalamin-independent methionine synthase II family protein [Amycolatopsis sp. RTGN1]